MSLALTIASTIVGVALVLVALRDIVHTLFRPSGWGSISEQTMRGIWRAFHHTPIQRGLLELAGPLALLAVLGTWALMLTLGWALIYFPFLPGSYNFAVGLPPGSRHGFMTAFYLSFVALSTLGYGDMTPIAGWLRLFTPVEALMGFLLLSAAISWMLSIYPVLGNRRSLALQISTLRRAELHSGISVFDLEGNATWQTLEQIARSLHTVRAELTQFPIAYYFLIPDEDASLAVQIEPLIELRDWALDPARGTNVRFAGALLAGAMDDLARDLAREFLGCPDASTVHALRAYARDHRQLPEQRRRAHGN